MKRRHVQPNTRTFTTLLAGLARIDDWAPYSNILQRVFTTYDQLLAHFEKLKIKSPESKDITPWPINSFLTLLGKSHHYSKMWDVFFSMEGRLAPDEHTYTVMLQALQKRASLDQQPVQSDLDLEEKGNITLVENKSWEDQYGLDGVPEEGWGLESTGQQETGQQVRESVTYRNAADARILWEHILKANKLNPGTVPISSHLIAPTLHLLARGRPSDHILAFNIISQYVKIKRPSGSGEGAALKQQTNAIELNGAVFFAILEVCIRSARPTLAMEYFQQVAEDEKTKGIIDSGHMKYIMRAFAMRRAPKGQTHDGREAISALQWMLQQPSQSLESDNKANRGHATSYSSTHLTPSTQHFVYALTAAWRGADMSSALAVLELMTGLKRAQFMTPVVSGKGDAGPIWPSRTQFVGCDWDVTCMALLVKTAETTQKMENMRIALRVLNAATPGRFLTKTHSKNTEDTILAQRELTMRTNRVLNSLLSQEAGEVEGDVWRDMKRAIVARSDRANKFPVKSWIDKTQENDTRKSRVFKDGDVKLLVTLKGGKSGWAKDL